MTDENESPDGGEATPDESSKAVELTEPAVIDETVEAKEPEDADDALEDGAVEAEETPTRRSAPRGIRRHIGAFWWRSPWSPPAGVAGWLYFYQYRVDQQTNAGGSKRRAGSREERHRGVAVLFAGVSRQRLRRSQVESDR